MATQNALQGQQASPPSAVDFNGVQGVLRAGGIKTTGRREEGRQPAPIAPNEDLQQPLHRWLLVSAADSDAGVINFGVFKANPL